MPLTFWSLNGILQWGRDLVIAEMTVSPPPGVRKPYLQWGRDLVIAEIMTRPLRSVTRRAFNGAAIW